MEKHEQFKPNDKIYQIFLQKDATAIVIESTVVDVTPESITYIPLGNIPDVSGKVITDTLKGGIPTPYSADEIDLMFSEFMHRTYGIGKGPFFQMTPKDLEHKIELLQDLLKKWKRIVRRQKEAEREAAKEAEKGESENEKP